MLITKKFITETSHIVRNCSSDRCKYSIHGHSYTIEVELYSKHLDNAQMTIDFGLMKGAIKSYIDSLDHCHLICSRDGQEYTDVCKKYSARWIELPFNPSAEMMAIWLFYIVDYILKHTNWNNGEDTNTLRVNSVTVHETATGKATAFIEDLINNHFDDETFKNILYSEAVKGEWNFSLYELLINNTNITNDRPEQQINL